MGKVAYWCAIVAALAAIKISFELLEKHMTGQSGSAWFDAGCGDGAAGTKANCAAVLASPYSHWPPKFPGSKTEHVPVAFLGLVYYIVLAIWLVGIGQVSRSRWWVHLGLLTMLAVGLLMSAYFMEVMFKRLDEWCPWCIVTHALNAMIAGCAILMWPRRPKPPAEGAPNGLPAPRPSARVGLLTLVLMVFAVVGSGAMLTAATRTGEAKGNKRNFEQCVDVLNRFKGNANVLVEMFRTAPVVQVTARGDDPVRGGVADAGAPLDAVIFSDFECPSCKRLADMIDKDVAPMFGGHLRIIFKHNPLNPACNPNMKSITHRHACDAAMLAEAARSLGGNNGFWCAHDYLFREQDQWKLHGVPVSEVAASCGLDAEGLRRAMQLPEIATRIREDAQQAGSLLLFSTPSIIVKGRAVDVIARHELVFWDRMADLYWRERNEPRPDSAKMPATTPKPVP